MPYSDEAKRQMAENAERHTGKLWMRGKAELVDSRFGPLTLGPMAQIEPGVEVWSRLDARMNTHEEAIGGIVVDTHGGSRYVSDDGEIIEQPARFKCYDWLAPFPQGAFVWLAESEIDRSTLAAVPPHRIAHAIRRFCTALCDHQRRRSSLLDHHEADLVNHAARLTAVLMMSR